MLHPSYSDLINVVNSEVEEGETPVVNSRYSIVMATSKRARQIVNGSKPLVEEAEGKKPLSIAVEELEQGLVKILSEEDEVIDFDGDFGEDEEFRAENGDAVLPAGDEADGDAEVTAEDGEE